MRYDGEDVAERRSRPDVDDLGPRPGLRQVPGVVWVLTGLFAAILLWWSFLTPMAHAPDEGSHAGLIEWLADGNRYPEYDDFNLYEGVLNAWLAQGPGEPVRTPELARPRGERPTLEGWGGRSRAAWPNQISQHPPLYYQAGALALRAVRSLPTDPQPLEREWHLLRLWNVVLVLPLPALCWVTARRLGAGGRASVAAATAPLAIPQLAHIGASINNDNLLVLLSAVLAVFLADVVRGDDALPKAALVGALTGLALWAKAFALVLVLWLGVAYGLRWWRSENRGRRRAVLALAVAWATAGATGAWWWVRNQLRHGEAFPSILDEVFMQRTPGFDADPIGYVRTYLPSMVHRFWGDFGGFAAPMTPGLIVLITGAALATMVAALLPGRVWPRSRGVPGLELAAFCSVVPILALLLLYLDVDRYRFSGRHAFMQGRYLYGAIVPMLVLIAIGLARLVGRWAPLGLLAAALVMQLDATRVVLRHLWAEEGASVGRSMESLLAWSPWPAAVVYVALGIVVVMSALSALTLWRNTTTA